MQESLSYAAFQRFFVPKNLANSAPITADAAAPKVLGVGKTFTIKKTTKVSGLSKAEKRIVKVTVNKKKRTVTVKGIKAGKATFKIGSKTYNVKVGATSITKKTVATSMKVGQKKTLSVNAVNGKGDTIQFTSSSKSTVKVNKASAKATSKKVASTTVTALKAGTAKITAKSKYTGKSKTFTIKVAAATVTPAPVVTTNPAVVATTPAATATVTNAPNIPGGNTTKAPETTSGAATNAPGSTDTANTNAPGTSDTPGTSNQPGATDVANTNAPGTTDAPSVSTNPAVTATPSAVEFTAKQTGEKKFVITNPTAMKKTDISITRGTSAVTIDNIQLNEDATVATVTLAGSIVETTYTVKVGDATTTFTGEASVVKDIQITSEYAPIKGELGSSTDENAKKATATYAVYNQFGEDVTAKTSLTANTSAKDVALNPTDGTMTITWEAAPRLNDVVSVVLMHQATGLST